jgi:hypothetical protein
VLRRDIFVFALAVAVGELWAVQKLVLFEV